MIVGWKAIFLLLDLYIWSVLRSGKLSQERQLYPESAPRNNHKLHLITYTCVNVLSIDNLVVTSLRLMQGNTAWLISEWRYRPVGSCNDLLSFTIVDHYQHLNTNKPLLDIQEKQVNTQSSTTSHPPQCHSPATHPQPTPSPQKPPLTTVQTLLPRGTTTTTPT